jgi:hypothetical protein
VRDAALVQRCPHSHCDMCHCQPVIMPYMETDGECTSKREYVHMSRHVIEKSLGAGSTANGSCPKTTGLLSIKTGCIRFPSLQISPTRVNLQALKKKFSAVRGSDLGVSATSTTVGTHLIRSQNRSIIRPYVYRHNSTSMHPSFLHSITRAVLP